VRIASYCEEVVELRMNLNLLPGTPISLTGILRKTRESLEATLGDQKAFFSIEAIVASVVADRSSRSVIF
jgi:hypothetical protein